MQLIKQEFQMPKHRARSCRGAAAATAWVIGKENVSGEINISGLGCGRAGLFALGDHSEADNFERGVNH